MFRESQQNKIHLLLSSSELPGKYSLNKDVPVDKGVEDPSAIINRVLRADDLTSQHHLLTDK